MQIKDVANCFEVPKRFVDADSVSLMSRAEGQKEATNAEAFSSGISIAKFTVTNALQPDFLASLPDGVSHQFQMRIADLGIAR